MKDLKFISRRPNEDLVRVIKRNWNIAEIVAELERLTVEKGIRGAYIELREPKKSAGVEVYRTDIYIPTTELTKYLGMRQ